MIFLWIISLVLFIIYALEIGMAAIGLQNHYRKYQEDVFQPISDKVLVSVVIAARNEEKNIRKLIDQLRSQKFPSNDYEIIVVNDHSTDNTDAELNNYSNYKNIHILDLPDNAEGKKAAIKLGTSIAKGELILTTDADCTISRNWINAFYASYCQNNSPKLVLGIVDVAPVKNIFHDFQRMDLLAMVFTGLGKSSNKKPVLGNAANMAFQRDLLIDEDVHKKQLASGDDIFLLHYVKKYYPGSIAICTDSESIVYTKPQTGTKDFLHQRIRWGSKAKYYTDYESIKLTLVVFLFNLTFCVGAVLSVVWKEFYYIPALYIAKTIIDLSLLMQANKFLRKHIMPEKVMLYQIVYPMYIFVMGIAANIFPYKWKGRAVK